MVGERTCNICPRQCGVARGLGFCGADDTMEVATICLHRGEEPAISGAEGIVNVFFAHCNLQCIYCQNGQISGRKPMAARSMSVDEVASEVEQLLPESCGSVGFVTAAHYIDHVIAIVEQLHADGVFPTVVYNSSGYESVEALKRLEGVVDVYLPDYKYHDSALSATLSHAADYPSVAQAALKEMRRQVGEGLKRDLSTGVAYRGMVVRHLVLPGAVVNSERCLEWLATEFDPKKLHISLMSQYYPPKEGLPQPMDRVLTVEEFRTVCDKAQILGFEEGWQQELESNINYRPDFMKEGNPFEK